MKNSVIVSFLAVSMFLTFFCGCNPNRPLTVRDSTGGIVTLKEPARRIVSTVPSNTEILYALGLKDEVVGLTKYCGKTCDTKGKAIIGGWVDPDYEKIRVLKPDLIFAFGGMQRKHLDKFREIAPTYCFEPTTVKQTLRVIIDIGRLTGRAPQAKEIVKRQQRILANVQAKVSSIPPEKRLRVARVFGTDTDVMTVGEKSFLTDVIKLAGGVNVFEDVNDDYFHVKFERLASLDPDLLIVHGEKTDVKQKRAAFEKNPDFSKLKAVKNGKVLVYLCDYICHPNAAIADTVEMVAKGLYPGLFSLQGDYPQRIISLGPAITEELYILGAEDRLIGCTVYCQRPPEAKKKEKVGTAIEVNLEKIIALRPDLVLATSLTDRGAKEKLKNLGIKTVTFPAAKDFSEICGQFLELGRLVGKEEQAAEIAAVARNRVDSIRKKIKDFEQPKVFIQVGAKPLVTATGDTFINDFIESAGGINIAKGVRSGLYSREEVVRQNPDIIIIVTMGIAGEEEKKTWAKYKTLNAVKNDRIYIIDSYRLCSPTPVSFAETLEGISCILHPQI